MTRIDDLHRKWSKDSAYRTPYESLEEVFQLAEALMAARTRAGLSQAQLAERMHTSQSYVARLESGKVHLSTEALARFAKATETRLKISFEPAQSQ